MNTMNSTPPPGTGEEPDLEALREAYQALPETEPPALLDQAILNSARRATGVQPRRWRLGGLRWIPAFATATVVVAALGLVMEQMTRSPRSTGQPGPTANSEHFEFDVMSSEEAGAILDAADTADLQMRSADPETGPLRETAAKPAAPSLGMPGESGLAAEQKAEPEIRSGIEARGSLPPMEQEPLTAPRLQNGENEPASETPDPPTPELWIRRIMRWKNLHQQQKFEEELAKFKAVYPDYELPDQLGSE